PDAAVTVHADDAVRAAGLVDGNLDAADGNIGAGGNVGVQHSRIVHRIDVIAGEHEHVIRIDRFDQVAVLMHRVDGARVPAFAAALLSGPDLDELAQLAPEEAPTLLHMPDQRLRFVLRQ